MKRARFEVILTMEPGKNNFALSGWPFWPPASLFARFRPTAGVCASLTPRWRPKFLRRKTRIYFCAVPMHIASACLTENYHGVVSVPVQVWYLWPEKG